MKYVRRVQWRWAALIVVLIGGGGVSYRLFHHVPPKSPVHAYVECTGSKSEQFSCWQSRYKAMVEQESPQVAFADARKAYDELSYVRSNCHQLSHVIGRAAGLKYGTVGEAFAHGDNFCWSGYYHGVMETIADQLGPDKLLAQINDICTSARTQRYSFYHYNCVHGLGHGLMAVFHTQLFETLKDCDLLTDSWEQQSCYSGVFMENVMDEITPGHHTAYLKADQPLYPCTAVDQRYKEQCYLMQTSHALVVEKEDFSTVFKLCEEVEAPFNVTCYQSLGRDASGRTVSNQEQTRTRCMLGPTAEAINNCFVGAVKDFISYFHNDQQGKDLCNSIDDPTIRANCLQTAVAYYATF